jgi:predicted amidohydrolase
LPLVSCFAADMLPCTLRCAADQEKFYFSPGDTGVKVFKTRYADIGVLICWDQARHPLVWLVLHCWLPAGQAFVQEVVVCAWQLLRGMRSFLSPAGWQQFHVLGVDDAL